MMWKNTTSQLVNQKWFHFSKANKVFLGYSLHSKTYIISTGPFWSIFESDIYNLCTTLLLCPVFTVFVLIFCCVQLVEQLEGVWETYMKVVDCFTASYTLFFAWSLKAKTVVHLTTETPLQFLSTWLAPQAEPGACEWTAEPVGADLF